MLVFEATFIFLLQISVIVQQYFFQAIRHALHTHFLPLAKIHELYLLNIDAIVSEFSNAARNQLPNDKLDEVRGKSIEIVRDAKYRRLMAKIDMPLALKLYNVYR